MTRPEPVRVALLNDYEVVVRGLSSMLQPYRDRVRVVELDSSLPVLQEVDVTLYDSFGHEPVTFGDLGDVVGNERAGRVVVFTWNMHPELVERSLASGCSGYLDKSMGAAGLVDAIERVAAGEVVVSPFRELDPPAAAGEGDGEADGDWPGRAQGLSPREAEVVALITVGLTNEDIARQTYLSINSIKTYIRNAYRKMGVTRRSQAVRWGLENSMTPSVKRDLLPDEDQPTGS
jgi:DNA-binding NarL/FixJ family response regulator